MMRVHRDRYSQSVSGDHWNSGATADAGGAVSGAMGSFFFAGARISAQARRRLALVQTP